MIKYGLLYIILFTYTSMMFKPVVPYLNDLIAHTLSYQSHMTTVHFENGKLHAHKEVINENAGNNDEEKPVQLKKDNQQSDHVLVVVAMLQKPIDYRSPYNCQPPGCIPDLNFPIFIPPPQSLA